MFKRFHACVLLACLLLSGLTVSAVRAEIVTPAITLDQPVVTASTAVAVHVLLRFEVPEIVPADGVQRSPVHLALVIDRSGSMAAAGRLEYAKKASRAIVSLLHPDDRLAIVEYDHHVNVLWPSAPVASPAMVHQLIDGLTPRGYTDLAGGLSAGIAEIQRDRDLGFTSRVILLSDGHANTGITHVPAIADLAARGRRNGVSVTTMGLGRDYNEDLMQAVAVAGGGRYYYIEDPAAMLRVYQAEMDKVLQQKTRGIALWFEQGTMVERADVYGHPAETSAGRIDIGLSDLYGGDNRNVLIALRLADLAEGEHVIGRVGLRYTDVEDGQERSQLLPVVVRASVDPDLVAGSLDAATAVEAALIVADERHDKAVRSFEAGDKDGALAALDAIRSEIETAHEKLGDPLLAKKLEALDLEHADMARAEEDRQYRLDYLKRSKEAFYGSRQGKRGKYLLSEGASGLEVENLQRRLGELGYYTGQIDGIYSDQVSAAVTAYQRANDLAVDGIAGPMTLRALGLF